MSSMNQPAIENRDERRECKAAVAQRRRHIKRIGKEASNSQHRNRGAQ